MWTKFLALAFTVYAFNESIFFASFPVLVRYNISRIMGG